ncbi:MAG: sugar ABC transporter permease [Spirochaetales bacterium]|nr:sugar ABC transporter permease [Spirochaetales bacterium]
MHSKKNLSGYIFIIPAALIYFTVIVLPAVYSFYLSFFKWNGIGPNRKFVGLNNYYHILFEDVIFERAALNNTIWILLVLTITVGFALSMALLLNRQFRGRTLFRGILYFPYVLSGVMVAIIWTWVYHPQLGLISGFLQLFNLQEYYSSPLAGVKTAFFAIYAAALWQGFGAPMILFLAGLKTIPVELYEAATIDGANRSQTFINITIPMLRETFVIVFATQIISAMKLYDIVYAMTEGGPANRTHTMATWMVRQTFIFANVGKGTSIAVVMVLVLMVVIIPYVMFMAKDTGK